jgi:hypothetical protein
MPLLWLGSSNDDYGPTPEAARGYNVARHILEEATGEHVDLVRKRIWLTPALPSLVARWLEEVQPDAVYLKANSYWICWPPISAAPGPPANAPTAATLPCKTGFSPSAPAST